MMLLNYHKGNWRLVHKNQPSITFVIVQIRQHTRLYANNHPSHYHVLWDENYFIAMWLFSMTNNFRYIYFRCTRFVSIISLDPSHQRSLFEQRWRRLAVLLYISVYVWVTIYDRKNTFRRNYIKTQSQCIHINFILNMFYWCLKILI